jgi:hypothetical protein
MLLLGIPDLNTDPSSPTMEYPNTPKLNQNIRVVERGILRWREHEFRSRQTHVHQSGFIALVQHAGIRNNEMS